jgi:hypothetical protein
MPSLTPSAELGRFDHESNIVFTGLPRLRFPLPLSSTHGGPGRFDKLRVLSLGRRTQGPEDVEGDGPPYLGSRVQIFRRGGARIGSPHSYDGTVG